MSPAELAAELADIRLAEWRSRAEAAEAASARKEYLLTLLSEAQKAEGRHVIALGVDVKAPAIFLQSNVGDEEAILGQLMKTVGPVLKSLHLLGRARDGDRAEAEALADQVVDLQARVDRAEAEVRDLRTVAADGVAEAVNALVSRLSDEELLRSLREASPEARAGWTRLLDLAKRMESP